MLRYNGEGDRSLRKRFDRYRRDIGRLFVNGHSENSRSLSLTRRDEERWEPLRPNAWWRADANRARIERRSVRHLRVLPASWSRGLSVFCLFCRRCPVNLSFKVERYPSGETRFATRLSVSFSLVCSLFTHTHRCNKSPDLLFSSPCASFFTFVSRSYSLHASLQYLVKS